MSHCEITPSVAMFWHRLLFHTLSHLCLILVQVTLDDHKSTSVDFKIVWSSSPDFLKYESYFSLPKFIKFPTEVPGQTAFAYFYPPSNSDYQATLDEKPPLLLGSHGMYYFKSMP